MIVGGGGGGRVVVVEVEQVVIDHLLFGLSRLQAASEKIGTGKHTVTIGSGGTDLQAQIVQELVEVILVL